MTSLPNLRQERFAHLVARGIPQERAYVEAGYKAKTPHHARSNGGVLMANQHVIDRVAELRAPIIAELEITTTQTLRQLAALAFADVGEIMSWGPKSIKVRVSKALTPAQRFMVKEVKKLPDGTVVVTLRDPVPALRLIGLHQGLFSDGGAVGAMPAQQNLTVNQDNRTVVFVDRPPDETREQWIARHRSAGPSALAAPVGAAARSTD